MVRYRQTDTRWIQGACVAGAYLVGVAVLFTRQLGEALVVPVPFAVSLEDYVTPTAERIVAAARQLMK